MSANNRTITYTITYTLMLMKRIIVITKIPKLL